MLLGLLAARFYDTIQKHAKTCFIRAKDVPAIKEIQVNLEFLCQKFLSGLETKLTVEELPGTHLQGCEKLILEIKPT